MMDGFSFYTIPLWIEYYLFSNCIGLLLKRTPEIIYLQKKSVNNSIRIHFDIVLDAPSQDSTLPATSKYLFLKFVITIFCLVQNTMFYNLNQVFLNSVFISLTMWEYLQGEGGLVSCDLMRSLQHLHQEGVDRRVPDEFEEEQMLQTLEADGAQGGEAEQQLGEPAGGGGEKKKKQTLAIIISRSAENCFFLLMFTVQNLWNCIPFNKMLIFCYQNPLLVLHLIVIGLHTQSFWIAIHFIWKYHSTTFILQL